MQIFNYDESTRDELFAEIDARRSDGRSFPNYPANTGKEKLAAALKADDEAKSGEAATKEQLTPTAPPDSSTPPRKGMDGYKPNDGKWPEEDKALYQGGAYRKKVNRHADTKQPHPLQGDGEIYYFRYVPADPRGNTHHAKNVDHFWLGSKEQFAETFEKVNPEPAAPASETPKE